MLPARSRPKRARISSQLGGSAAGAISTVFVVYRSASIHEIAAIDSMRRS